MSEYAITVVQLDERGRITDLAQYETARTAPEMEDRVTELHRDFPAPGFRVDVRAISRPATRT